MKIELDIFFILITSACYGLIISILMILYFNFGEKLQIWSERYNPPKKWIRRAFHLCSFLVTFLILIYTFLFWISFEIDHIITIASSTGSQVILLFLISVIFIIPFIFLWKKIFRKFNVKKLWG